jgi:hypothetical protein
MRIIIVFLSILSFTFSGYTQAVCGFKAPSITPMASISSTTGDGIGDDANPIVRRPRILDNFIIIFPVRFIILNDTSHYVTEEKISETLENMNIAFDGANIQFEMDQSPKYIMDEEFFVMAEEKEPELFRKYFQPGVINIYCVETIKLLDSKADEFVGYTYHPATVAHLADKRNMIVISYDGLMLESTVLIHEMGHFFGLYHTHETAFGEESVSRVDCKATGDQLCDTPADPGNLATNVDGTVEGDCQYTNADKATDQYGSTFYPPVQNFMSYAPDNCRNEFTLGQCNRMARVARFLRNDLKYRTLAIKGGGVTHLSYEDSYADLEQAFEKSKFSRKDWAVVLVYKDSIQWCERLMYEILNSSVLKPFFSEAGAYSLVMYDMDRDRNAIPDFLGNDVFHLPLRDNSDYNQMKNALLPEIGRFPAIFVLGFHQTEQLHFSILFHSNGYIKPRELAKKLVDLQSVKFALRT